MKNINIVAVFVLLFVAAGAGFWFGQQGTGSSVAASGEPDKSEPLYWVAPMDPNYRRDKPGKSPMGMDLVPVYEETGNGADAGPGTIKISPEVVNNLGVRTAKVEYGRLATRIKTVGYVQYDEDRLVHMHPRVEGWVDRLYVKAAGDPVSEGEPIYDLYSPQLVNAQEEYLLAKNRNDLKLLQSSQERLRALQIAESFISRLDKTRKVSQTVTFYAPQSGFVDNLNIREGFYVIPGTTLMSIATLDEVWVEAEVFERQAALVKVGQPVTMSLDYLPGEQWQGEVDYVYPTLDPQNRTARIRLRFDNDRQILKPNMFAEVVIHPADREDVLLIPREAVIRTGHQDRVVLALGDGRFKSIAVQLGATDDTNAEILDGLEAGETVVTSAQFLLDSESSKTSDFMRMQATNEKPRQVWVAATIGQVMADMEMVKLTHEPIPEWDWGVMTMMFPVADGVDLDQLQPGMEVHVQIEQTGDTDWQLIAIHIPDGQTETQAETGMDHSQMDHSQMDHSQMDHSQMNHGQQEMQND